MAEAYPKLFLYPDSDLRQEGSSGKRPGHSHNQENDTSARLLDGIAGVIETMADSHIAPGEDGDEKSNADKDVFNQTAVFAIYGGWGTGKTTFMWDLYEKLDAGGKVYPVWFNLWEHDKDVQPIVAMLNLASDSLSLGEEDKERFLTHLKMIGMGFYDTAIHAASTVTGGMVALPTVTQIKKYHDMVKNETWLTMENQTKQTQAFKDVVKTLIDITKGPIVFFIDDLDRCAPQVAVDLLEKIRLYLTLPGCIFVIGADDTIIRRTIGHAYITDSDQEYAKLAVHDPKNTGEVEQAIRLCKEKIGKGYLDKMVQYAFYLPVLGEKDSRNFLEEILKENRLLLDNENKLPIGEDAIDVLYAGITSMNASRRETIRVGNAFTLNYYLSQPKIKNYRPSITALITVLQVLHPEAYTALLKNDNRGRTLHLFLRQNQRPRFTRAEGPEDPNDLRDSDEYDKWIADIAGLPNMVDAVGIVPDVEMEHLGEYLELSSSAAPSSLETSFFFPSPSSRETTRPNQWGRGSKLFPTNMEMEEGSTHGYGRPLIEVRKDLRGKGAHAVSKKVRIGHYLWRVLHHFEGSRFLLITENVIGLHCYYDFESRDRDWKQWAVDAVARGMSPEATKTIIDGLRLIEMTEAKKFFSSDSARIGYSTVDKDHTTGLWWWTHTMSQDFERNAVVSEDGKVLKNARDPHNKHGGIRPVLELDLENLGN